MFVDSPPSNSFLQSFHTQAIESKNPNMKKREAIAARVRKFEAGDVENVLSLAQKYASWDATPTREDIEGFHSANPEFFFVAELNQILFVFVYCIESSPPADVIDT